MRSASIALLLLITWSTGFSAELPITPFDAEYTLYKGKQKMGQSTLSLDKSSNRLRWRLASELTGIYALFSNKNPLSLSIQERFGSDFRLATIQLSISSDAQPNEIVTFNWSEQNIKIKRKNFNQTIPLKNAVYDYLSIHWLAAQMTANDGSTTEFEFYRKGKLVKSSLTFVGEESLDINNQSRTVKKYRHSFQASSRSYEYYYGSDNLLLPLKIVKIKKGKTSSIMLFDRLN